MPSDILPHAQRHLVDHRVIVDTGLVVHAPAAADELQPALVDQILHRGDHLLVLLKVPAPEEGRLHVDEAEDEGEDEGDDVGADKTTSQLFRR